MHRARLLLSVGLILLLVLAGCNQGSNPSMSSNSSGANSGGQVSLSMIDDPPSGVTVLFFQISLTAAYLTPAAMGSSTVSLLNNNTPVQVDVTQLQAISAFLSTANVPSGTYNSLTLTFANPQLVIFNAADQALASTCPLNTVCQLTPSIDNSSSLTFSSAPFPVAVAENMPLGFLLDFHLNQVIQSDLSVNLGVTDGVTVSELPSAPPQGFPPFGFLVGTVESVTSNNPSQFTLQTRDGRTFTVDVNSSTIYQNFPTSVCATSSFSCLAKGEVVQVQVANVEMGGTLLAAQVTFIQLSSQQVVEGNIIGLSNDNTVMKLLLHWSPDSGLFPFGGVASVTVSPTASFSVESDNFTTIPSGLTFTSTSSLLVGQQVQVEVVAGSLTNSGGSGPWAPPLVSFTTDKVELEPSQITGVVTKITSGTSFTITTLPSFFAFWSNQTQSSWMPMTITVDTTSQTTYLNLSPDSFAGVTPNSLVSVRGWLFSTPSSSTPSTQVAETVLGRPQRFF